MDGSGEPGSRGGEQPSASTPGPQLTPRTWYGLYEAALRRLGSPADARRIVEEASGSRRRAWLGRPGELAPEEGALRCLEMVERRAAGEPLQYVLGTWGFRSLELCVDPRVLIPRPETEQVVDVAITELRHLPRPCDVADLGTGCGAIALALVDEITDVTVWATDTSSDALTVARANLAGLGARAQRVRLLRGSWFEALPGELRGRLPLLVSNPPYVASGEVGALDPVVSRWEPLEALVPGPTGLEAITEIVLGAPLWLARPGTAVIEIAPHQAEAAVALAREAGFREVDVEPDLADRARVLVGRL